MKVVVLDEYVNARKSIVTEIFHDGDIIYVNNIDDAKKIISNKKFDVFFFDSCHYGADGVRFISEISICDFPQIIVITNSNNTEIDALIITLFKMSGAKRIYFRDRMINNDCDIYSIIDDIKEFYEFHIDDNLSLLPKTFSNDEMEVIVNESQLINYYQPQYYKEIDKPISLEALIRCVHPIYGLIPPESFIHLIDVDTLFWKVLENSIIDLGCLPSNIKLSININQRTLQKPISKDLLELCYRYNFEPKRLTLELTEEEAFDGGIISLANVIAIRIAGIGLAIDDFGTGHSSLSQLVSLPFTELKVDRSFIIGIQNSYKNQEILKISMMLAKSLGMNLIAEGVEEIDTLKYIKRLGVNYYQGYLFCSPMPLDEIIDLFN